MSTVKVTIDEKQPLLANTSAKRVTIAEPSDDNITPTPSKSNPVPPSPSKSSPPAEDYTGGIYIMLFITFLASVCFSIVLPSIWPFMQNKMHAEKSLVGWAVAVNSGGSFLASPVFGAWGDRRTTREVLGVTLVLMIIGNVMYSLSENIYMLLAGRFVVGVAAANYAVAQTYISYATTPDNRTKIMAYNSAANVLGFIIGPSLALLFTVFHYNVAGVELNDYTMPGYFSAVLSLLGLFSLVTLKEISASTKRQKKPPTSGSTKYATGSGFYSGGGSVKDISQIIKMKKDIPVFPVVVSLIAYFAYTASFTVFETIGTPYTQEDFNWSVTENSILYAVLGVLCIISLVVLQIFVRFFNDRVLVVGTTVFMVAGFGVLFDIQNHLVSLPRFAIGVGLTAAGYSTSVAVLISIYSKVLEGLDQGMMMGWLSSAGSIARIIGPVFASYSFAWGGGRLVFASMMGLMFVVFVILVASYRALKPRTGQEPIN